MSRFTHDDTLDLTEDESEDNQNTEVETDHHFYSLQGRLPPLIPIPKINSPVLKVANTNVPSLTRINSKNGPDFGIHSKIIKSQQNTMHTQVSAAGKLVVIKKNNKLYKIVIPHNVMPKPNTCQSQGPVIINVPEVGPLMIKIDPRIKKDPISEYASPLDPFSLNFEEIIEKAAVLEMLNNSTLGLDCWEKNKKLSSKFCGFSKMTSSGKCLNTLNILINKKKSQLCDQMKLLNNPIIRKNYETITSDNNNSLLNVKIRPLEDSKKAKLGKYATRKLKKKKSTLNNILLKFPQSKQKIPVVLIEPLFKDFVGLCHVNIVKSTIIEKMFDKEEGSLSLSKINDIKSRREMMKSFIISNSKQFTDEIDCKKSLLVLNVHNFSIINFETEYSKANIVFPINQIKYLPKEILESLQFFLAVTKGYIKLVQSNILCSYLNKQTGAI